MEDDILLDISNLLYNHQYGFRIGHATDLALASILHLIYKAWDNCQLI